MRAVSMECNAAVVHRRQGVVCEASNEGQSTIGCMPRVCVQRAYLRWCTEDKECSHRGRKKERERAQRELERFPQEHAHGSETIHCASPGRARREKEEILVVWVVCVCVCGWVVRESERE